MQFLRDVNILGTALARFQLTFERYEKQYPSTERPKAAPAIENSDSIWIQCVGDFYQTLQECDSLLSRYGYLRNGRSHAVFNLHWWQSVEPTVDRLMAKLRLHIDKVDFYAKPHEFNAVIRNGSEIQQLRRQVANLERFLISGPEQSQALWTDCIPEELKVKLEEHFQTNTPSWSPRGSEWPLKEAFEALTFHFAASTVTFNPEPGSDTIPNVSHFLGLAKSIWILEKIKQSPQFRNVGSGSIWADRMRGFEDDLRGQMHRFEAGELAKPSTQQLLSLPTSFYTIGGGDTNDTDPLNAGQAGPSEEKILEIQIESDSDDRESALLVFRENETDFRFVVSTKTVGSLLAQYDKEITVSMDINRFIPVYANPFRGGSPQYNVLLLNQRGKKPKEFQLLCHEDLAKLQRALLGYRVHHEMPVARWCINGSQAPGDSGQGILQLWQYKPLPAMSTTDMSGASDGSSSDKALRSLTSTSAAQKSPTSPNVGGTIDFVGWSGFPHAPLSRKSDLCESPISPSDRTDVQLSRQTSNTAKRESLRMLSKELRYSRTSSVTASSSNGYRPCRNSSTMSSVPSTTRSSVVSAIRGPRGDGVAFSKPELPALVILTWCEGRYSFLHLTRK